MNLKGGDIGRVDMVEVVGGELIFLFFKFGHV